MFVKICSCWSARLVRVVMLNNVVVGSVWFSMCWAMAVVLPVPVQDLMIIVSKFSNVSRESPWLTKSLLKVICFTLLRSGVTGWWGFHLATNSLSLPAFRSTQTK